MFVNKKTLEIIDYAALKQLFPRATFPADPADAGVDFRLTGTNPPNTLLMIYSDIADWQRLHDVVAPSIELYQAAISISPVFNEDENRWETGWFVRNMTQDELVAFNGARAAQNNATRRTAYQNEADPLFFKYQREEIEKQVWIDKVAEIRTRFPNPALVTIPA